MTNYCTYPLQPTAALRAPMSMCMCMRFQPEPDAVEFVHTPAR